MGIVGNVLLFTVFMGAVFDTPNPVNLLGQAGRQLMFIAVSIYGWVRWAQHRHVSGIGRGTAMGECPSPHPAGIRA